MEKSVAVSWKCFCSEMDRFRCRMFANDSSRTIPGNRCLRPGHEGHLPDEPRTMYVTIQLVHFLKSFKNVWCNEISVLTLYHANLNKQCN